MEVAFYEATDTVSNNYQSPNHPQQNNQNITQTKLYRYNNHKTKIIPYTIIQKGG